MAEPIMNPYAGYASDEPVLNIDESFESYGAQPEEELPIEDAATGEVQEVEETPEVQAESGQSKLTLRQSKERWMNMPDGPEKEQAKDEYAKEHFGRNTYQELEEWRQNRGSLTQALQDNSVLFNPAFSETMRAAPQGLLDFGTDLLNLIPKVNIPKVSKFENEGAQAFREISSLVGPFIILKGKGLDVATKVHASKTAPIWLQHLGNNKAFANFAKVGLDIGTGTFTDVVSKINEANDTLATSWKRGKWWGHQLIPETWTSDKLSPDLKHRANVLEGVRLGFLSNAAEIFVKLARAGRSVERTSKFLAENPANQKNLDELVVDPLDSKVYSDDVVEDVFMRDSAKYERDVNKLSDYFLTQGEPITKPTVGIHKFDDAGSAGLRTKNYGGILEAAVDQARIANQEGTTFGRLANILTDATRKFGLTDDVITNRSIIKHLREELLNGGKYSFKLPNGKKLSWKKIDLEGRILAEVLADPTLPRGDLVKILNKFKVVQKGVSKVNPVGYKALDKAIKTNLEMWSDLNNHKAKAYLLTSEAGQISDFAEGTRFTDSPEVLERANEQLLDRIELFEIESSIADIDWKAAQQASAALEQGVNAKAADTALTRVEQLTTNYNTAISDIIPKAKNFRKALEQIQNTSPEFANALRLAYEMSDGNIQSIKGMNRTAQNLLGTYSKAIVDGAPEIPSLFNRALMTNIFNSMLSAIRTPVKALTGNFGGFISEPVSVMYGALRSGDTIQMRRAAHMYFGWQDTFQKSFEYMGRVFRKAATSPGEIGHLQRADLAIEKMQGLEFAQAWAEAASKNGEDGAKTILNWAEQLDALGRNPVLRFNPNAMTALDGFTEASQKVAMDKGLAFDILLEKYPNGKWTAKEFQEVWEDLYTKGWDEKGFISQSAVEFSRREIALNLDTPLVKRLNPLIKQFPILRSIFWFPTTQMNVLDIFGKYSNLSRVKIGTDFAGDYAELLGPFGTRSAESFTADEIVRVLAKHGIDSSGDIMSKFKHLRNKTRGRVAIGNLAVMGAWGLFTQDRIRGNGIWDKQVQRTRLSQGWKAKTFQGLDGNWYSYEFLGPIGDWLALTTDVLDNFNSISTNTLEEFGKKMAFVLGASFTRPSLFGSMEPLFAILGGNENARNRWISQTTNSLFPMSGLRNEMGQNMFGLLREIEDNDIGEMIRNRNNYLDMFDKAGALPNLVDWVTGKPINMAEGGFFARVRNNSSPIKIYPNPTPEGEFLINVEYDGIPYFTNSAGGVPYTTKEKQELATLVGRHGYFTKELRSIMKLADKLTYKTPEGKTIKGYINIMNYGRKNGLTSAELEKIGDIHSMIDSALSMAKNLAESELSTRSRIELEEAKKFYKIKAAEQVDIDAVLELNQPSN